MVRIDIKNLQEIPNIGKAIEKNFNIIGINFPKQLIGKDPYKMYSRLCKATNQEHDPCVIDVFISAVRYMEGGPPKKWWEFTEERKNKLGDNNMSQSLSFNERCYALLKQIPKGKVTSYKEMARALGTNSWRAVGTALAKNNNLIKIPCHRVIRSDGTVGHYALGTDKKVELLKSEGVDISNGKINKLEIFFYKFSV